MTNKPCYTYRLVYTHQSWDVYVTIPDGNTYVPKEVLPDMSYDFVLTKFGAKHTAKKMIRKLKAGKAKAANPYVIEGKYCQ